MWIVCRSRLPISTKRRIASHRAKHNTASRRVCISSLPARNGSVHLSGLADAFSHHGAHNQLANDRGIASASRLYSAHHASSGIASDIEDAEQQLERFENLAARGKATIPQATSALLSFKSALNGMDVTEQRKLATRFRPGARVLKWMQGLQGLDTDHVASLNDTIIFTWFIVLEGSESQVIDWLATHKSTLSGYVNSKVDSRDARRIKRMDETVSNVVAAHIRLASDATANPAPRFFFDAIRKLPAGLPKKPKTFVVGAAVHLSRALLRGDCLPCDPELYDAFMDWYLKVTPDWVTRETRHSWLALFHPTDPNPYHILAVAKKMFGGYLPGKDFENKLRRHFMLASYLRASFVLRLLADTAEADWPDQNIAKYGDAVWSARAKILEAMQRDPKLQKLIYEYGPQMLRDEIHTPDKDAVDILLEVRGMGRHGNQ